MDEALTFPLIYCARHSKYQLNLVCRQPNCPLKGAICCRCQLSLHNGNGHTFDSFVPLDEVILLAQNQMATKYTDYEQQADSIIEFNRDNATSLSQSLVLLQQAMQEQVREECLLVGGFFNKYRELVGVVSTINFPEVKYETPTGDGDQPKDVFLRLMEEIAHKIQVIDGEYCLDKADIGDCIDSLIRRKKQTLKQLEQMYKETLSRARLMQQLFKTGCVLGIDSGLKIEQFNDWQVAYDQPYSHDTRYDVLEQMPHDDTTLVCVAAVKNNNILLCGIDYASNVFKETHSITIANYSPHGLYWYNVRDKAFGFADCEQIQLQDGDSMDGEYRLSWNLNGMGGYRCGVQSTDCQDIRKMILIYCLSV